MKSYYRIAGICSALLLLFGALPLSGSDMSGSVKFGGVLIDEEGNPGVNHSTFNTYEGVALSLERFRYQFDNGVRFTANLKNITMNNRNLRMALGKSGLYQVKFNNSQYRRLYSEDGSRYTRRRNTGGEAWFRPHRYAKLYAGYNRTDRYGDRLSVLGDQVSLAAGAIDYNNKAMHGGLTLTKDRRELDVNYRTTKYTDDLGIDSDRTGNRFRATMRTPVPKYDNVFLYAGYQHYLFYVDDSYDSLSANSSWFGGRANLSHGFSVRANFIWDRARRTGDLVATDNLATSLYVSKSWIQKGGVTLGYRHEINDDVFDELSGNGYLVSAWYAATERLRVKAGVGIEQSEVNAGETVVGDEDKSREYFSVRYSIQPKSQVRFQVEHRSRDNDQIGSSVDYTRFGGDIFFAENQYGDLSFSYSYLDGEYELTEGLFTFRDHVLSGDLTLPEYRNVRLLGGGSYVRSLEDTDVESFSVRLGASFELTDAQRLKFVWTGHNFDDLADVTPPYTRYYTANIIEVFLVSDL